MATRRARGFIGDRARRASRREAPHSCPTPTPMFQVRRILVATDFSPCARLALDHASELAKRFGAEILLLHVVPYSDQYMPFPDMLQFAQLWLGSAHEHANAGLAAERKLVSGPIVKTEVRDGSPHECILAAAADAKADL